MAVKRFLLFYFVEAGLHCPQFKYCQLGVDHTEVELQI